MSSGIGAATVSVPRTQSPGEIAAEWAVTHRVVVGRWRVRFRCAGVGPPVVLVHGLGVSADYWYRTAPAIAAAGFRVFAPDLPGFGLTEGPAGLPITRQAASLGRWADALGIGPAVYLGHSLSCQTVLEIAARSPRRVRAVVLAAPTGAPGPWRLAAQAWGLARDAFREPGSLFPHVVMAYLRAGLRRYTATWLHGAEHQPLELLPAVACPGLIVLGDDDPVVSREFADALAAGLRAGGRIVCIPAGAHAVFWDRPAEFNAAVGEFLRSLPEAEQDEAARPRH